MNLLISHPVYLLKFLIYLLSAFVASTALTQDENYVAFHKLGDVALDVTSVIVVAKFNITQLTVQLGDIDKLMIATHDYLAIISRQNEISQIAHALHNQYLVVEQQL